MDNPRLHYMAGKSFFIGENISTEYLLSSESVPYRHEYLIGQKYLNWEDLSFSKETFEPLLFSTKDKVSGILLPIYHALELKAYLNNPDLFPLSEEQKKTFRVDLISFITNSAQEDKDWSMIGLEGASFREKAQILLEHIQTFRNWIVPYPVDGLQVLLQEGMAKGNDEYEKNWCALQLALLFLQEKRDKDGIQAIFDQLIQEDDGTILLREQDKSLLDEINRLINQLNPDFSRHE
jgi:hypothetical protein